MQPLVELVSRFSSRKFVVAITGVVFLGLAEQWTEMVALVGLYCGFNVAEKFVGEEEE